ncbi:hypothetical protein CASFOL_009246 [Castilleja foliolosa]|uniref:Transposase, Ptta/En/Spm, plant n=1 Tax=Castilleja foliolosa TaxID=1961234 RepID=A0ABD3DYN9_9LAMI
MQPNQGAYRRSIVQSLSDIRDSRASLSSTPPLMDDDDCSDPDETIPPTPSPPTPSDDGSFSPTIIGISNKIHVFILGDKVRSDVKGLAKVLREIIESRIHDDGWKLKKVPKSYRHMWWASFQWRRAYWDINTYPTKLMESKFQRTIGQAYNNRLYNWRAGYFLLNRGIPKCVGKIRWRAWLVEWDKEEEKKKSAQARRNRMSEPAGPGTGIAKHRGRVKTGSSDGQENSAKTGTEPTHFDILLSYHRNSDGTYTDGKAQKIADEYLTTLEQMRVDAEEGTVIDPNDVYLDVVGSQKGRCYGLGSLGKKFATRSSCFQPDTRFVELREQLLQQQQEMQLIREERDRETRERDEEIQRLLEDYTRSQMDFQSILAQQVQAAVALAMSGQTQPPPT